MKRAIEIMLKSGFSENTPPRSGTTDKAAVFSVDEKKNRSFMKEVAITTDRDMIKALASIRFYVRGAK